MIASVATTAGLSAQRSAEGLLTRRGGGGTIICKKIPPPLHVVLLVPLILGDNSLRNPYIELTLFNIAIKPSEKNCPPS